MEHDGDIVLVATSDDQAATVWAAIQGWQSPNAAFSSGDGNAFVRRAQRPYR